MCGGHVFLFKPELSLSGIWPSSNPVPHTLLAISNFQMESGAPDIQPHTLASGNSQPKILKTVVDISPYTLIAIMALVNTLSHLLDNITQHLALALGLAQA